MSVGFSEIQIRDCGRSSDTLFEVRHAGDGDISTDVGIEFVRVVETAVTLEPASCALLTIWALEYFVIVHRIMPV